MERPSPIMAMSGSVILVLVIVVYIATLTEVTVAEMQMVQLRDSGTALIGHKFGVSRMRVLGIPLETSSLEIGILE
jgi:hypothetical protein